MKVFYYCRRHYQKLLNLFRKEKKYVAKSGAIHDITENGAILIRCKSFELGKKD